jgi:hypothetical protein
MNLKNSLASNVSAPIPEDEMMKKKVKIGSFVFIFITISDLIISLFTNIMNLIYFDEFKYDYLTYFILFLLSYVCFFISFLFINSQCICRLLFFYGILLIFYFAFEFYYQIQIINNLSDFMKDDYEKNNYDLIIVSFIILSFIIRIIILIVLYKYKNKLSNYEKFQRLIDHENFIENIENKVDKSSVRWSDASNKNNSNNFDNKEEIDLQLLSKSTNS